jgi:hypothetical protein
MSESPLSMLRREPPAFNRMRGANPVSRRMPIPMTTDVGEFVEEKGLPLADLIAMGAAFYPPTLPPAAAWFTAREAAKGNVIGALGAATMPALGRLGLATGAGAMAMEPSEANSDESLVREREPRKYFADGGSVGRFLGGDPNLAQAGYRPEHNYFSYATAPGNLAEAPTETLTGTAPTPYSPPTAFPAAPGGGTDEQGLPVTGTGQLPSGLQGVVSRGFSGLSPSTKGSLIGTGLSAVTGIPGLGMLGSVVGSLSDVVNTNSIINDFNAANPQGRVGPTNTLGFMDALRAVGNGLTFGIAGKNAYSTMVDNLTNSSALGSTLGFGTRGEREGPDAPVTAAGVPIDVNTPLDAQISAGGGDTGYGPGDQAGGFAGQSSADVGGVTGSGGGFFARGGLARMRKYHG